jgi:hypothetical protein
MLFAVSIPDTFYIPPKLTNGMILVGFEPISDRLLTSLSTMEYAVIILDIDGNHLGALTEHWLVAVGFPMCSGKLYLVGMPFLRFCSRCKCRLFAANIPLFLLFIYFFHFFHL